MPFKRLFKNSLYQTALSLCFGLLLIILTMIIATSIIKTYPSAAQHALDRLQPDPIDYLGRLNFDEVPIDKNQVWLYVDYYEQVKRVLGEKFPEVNGVLGCCYYYLGQNKKAEELMTRYLKQAPGYFWTYYDLAILSLENGDQANAAAILVEALKVNPKDTMDILGQSLRIYLPLLNNNVDAAGVMLEARLQRGYAQASLLLQGLQQSNADISKMGLTVYVF